MKKTLLTILCTVLVCSCVMGVTLAFLMDSTETITNTFTIGNIDITLTETKGTLDGNTRNFKMVPGSTIVKDPTVTVVGGSEACYLFVKVVKSDNFADFMTYAMADGWTELEAGVYYRKVEATTADKPFDVLKDNQVTVLDAITKDQIDADDFVYPTLSFTAYAVQSENVATAAAAWALLNP